MTVPAFGLFLRRLREARTLSLRELSKLAEVDHAYLYRLEQGEKESPSDDAVAKIARGLKVTKRQERLLRFFVGKSLPEELLAPVIVDDEAIDIEDFESAAQMSFRGKASATTEEWRQAIERIRKIRQEMEGG